MLGPGDDFGVGDAVRSAFRERGHVNILIAGRTGVGKSTLINAVFQGNLATTGQGRPVTPHTREVTTEGVPLSIFDTRGLELSEFQKTFDELAHLLKDRGSDPDPSRHIHVCWVCVSEDGARVEDAESKLVGLLAASVPVVGVITKARADNGFRAKVQELLPEARSVVRVRALPERLDDGHELQTMGLVELVEITREMVPEGHRNAFTAAQRADVRLKARESRLVVGSAALAAAAIGATPIPFSDAALLVPVQVGMLARITAIFGVPLGEAALKTLVASVGSGGATLAGRSIVISALKLIPGFGQLVGGTIAAATAAALTTALGTTYIAVLTRLYERSEGQPPTPEEITRAFGEELASRRTDAGAQAAPMPPGDTPWTPSD